MVITGLQLVAPPVVFGRLDSTARHPSMLGVHGLWPPLEVNPLELRMRIPSLSMPVLPAANTAGPALVRGNHIPQHPLAATELETASASGMKGIMAGAHRSSAADRAMRSMYGTAGAEFLVPSGSAGACKRHTGGTKGQTITEIDEDGETYLVRIRQARSVQPPSLSFYCKGNEMRVIENSLKVTFSILYIPCVFECSKVLNPTIVYVSLDIG